MRLSVACAWRFSAIGLSLLGGRDKYAYFRVGGKRGGLYRHQKRANIYKMNLKWNLKR